MDSHDQAIAAGALELGIHLNAEQVRLLDVHLAAVLETNRVMNLTAIDESDAVALHVIDSLTALGELQATPPGAFADLGSGPGYPGIPLAVVSGRNVVLVESVKKKAAFLEEVVARLRLEATVRPIRAEELALEAPTEFSAVTARALSSLPSLVELASPLLQVGGVLICLKGRLDEEELLRGDKAGALCGMRRSSTSPVSVPGVTASRSIVTYQKVSEARVRLPRRPGMAQRQPLA